MKFELAESHILSMRMRLRATRLAVTPRMESQAKLRIVVEDGRRHQAQHFRSAVGIRQDFLLHYVGTA